MEDLILEKEVGNSVDSECTNDPERQIESDTSFMDEIEKITAFCETIVPADEDPTEVDTEVVPTGFIEESIPVEIGDALPDMNSEEVISNNLGGDNMATEELQEDAVVEEVEDVVEEAAEEIETPEAEAPSEDVEEAAADVEDAPELAIEPLVVLGEASDKEVDELEADMQALTQGDTNLDEMLENEEFGLSPLTEGESGTPAADVAADVVEENSEAIVDEASAATESLTVTGLIGGFKF